MSGSFASVGGTAAPAFALVPERLPPVLLAMLVVGATAAIGIATAAVPTPTLAAAALALPVLALVPRYPWIGLVILVATSWANLSEVLATRNGLPSLDRLLLPGLALLVTARWWFLREQPGGDRVVALVLIAVAASILASFLHANRPELVGEALERFLRDALLVFVVVALIREPVHLRLAAWAVLAGGALVALACVGRLTAPELVGDAGGLARAAVMHIAGEIDDLRLVGPLDDPNSLAQVLLPLLPLAWSRAVHERSLALRALAAVAGLLVVVTLLATYSRSALLVAFAVVGLCWLAWHRRRLLPPLLVGVAALAAVPYLPVTWTERVGQLGAVLAGERMGVDRAISGRLDEMGVAVRMFADHPLTGVGVRHYPAQFERYASSERLRPRGEPRNAHSLPLEVAAERGLPGLIVLGGVLVAIALRLARVRAALCMLPSRAQDARLVESLALALVAYGGMSLFMHENYSHYMWLLAALALAAPAMLAVRDPERADPATHLPESHR